VITVFGWAVRQKKRPVFPLHFLFTIPSHFKVPEFHTSCWYAQHIADFVRLTLRRRTDRGRAKMSRDDLMKADLLSEIVLLASGAAILMTFVMVVGLALTRAAALQ
jgi:hypothetical protein